MTIHDQALRFEGLVCIISREGTYFTHPPPQVLTDTHVFGDYVWLVEAKADSGVARYDSIHPIACCTSYVEACKAAHAAHEEVVADDIVWNNIHIRRLARAHARCEDAVRYPQKDYLRQFQQKKETKAPA